MCNFDKIIPTVIYWQCFKPENGSVLDRHRNAKLDFIHRDPENFSAMIWLINTTIQ